jgi:hypothetical protein
MTYLGTKNDAKTQSRLLNSSNRDPEKGRALATVNILESVVQIGLSIFADQYEV